MSPAFLPQLLTEHGAPGSPPTGRSTFLPARVAPHAGGDVVFTLMQERGAYVLTEFSPHADRPREVVRGSLEAALAALPRSLGVLI